MSVEKKVSTAFSHEHEVGVKWKVQRGWRASQAQHLGVLVGGVVVEDDVDHLAGRHRALDRVEEADELLVPVALPCSGRSRVPSSTLSAANRVVVPWRL